MYIVRSVGVLSVAKISGCIYAVMALIFVPFVLMAGLMGALGALANSGSHDNPIAAFGAVGMVLLAIFIPIFYGIFGFIAGLIGALLYNLMAKWVGGFEIELQQPAPVPAAPAASAW